MAGDECPIADIPARLHRQGRPSQMVARDDILFVRHPSIQGAVYGVSIPEHHVANQSANSLLLNEGGRAIDVLYDTKNGRHWLEHQIAKLKVADILALNLPNENTVRRDREGNVLSGATTTHLK